MGPSPTLWWRWLLGQMDLEAANSVASYEEEQNPRHGGSELELKDPGLLREPKGLGGSLGGPALARGAVLLLAAHGRVQGTRTAGPWLLSSSQMVREQPEEPR